MSRLLCTTRTSDKSRRPPLPCTKTCHEQHQQMPNDLRTGDTDAKCLPWPFPLAVLACPSPAPSTRTLLVQNHTNGTAELLRSITTPGPRRHRCAKARRTPKPCAFLSASNSNVNPRKKRHNLIRKIALHQVMVVSRRSRFCETGQT